MASIEPTKTGPDGKPVRETRWRARYRDPSGRSRSRTFDRKVDAQQYLSGVETDIDRGRWADPQLQRTTFDSWAERWLDTLDVRPSTRHGYLHGLRRLRGRFTGERISTIDRAAVRAFVAEMRRGGYAPKTIRSTILVLKLVLDLPLEDKVIFENPAVRQKLGSSRQREPVFLTAARAAGARRRRRSALDGADPVRRLHRAAACRAGRPACQAPRSPARPRRDTGHLDPRQRQPRGRTDEDLRDPDGAAAELPARADGRPPRPPGRRRRVDARRRRPRVRRPSGWPSSQRQAPAPRHPAGRSADRATRRVPDLRPPPHVRFAPHRGRRPSPGDHGAPRAQGHQDDAQHLRPPLPRAPRRAERSSRFDLSERIGANDGAGDRARAHWRCSHAAWLKTCCCSAPIRPSRPTVVSGPANWRQLEKVRPTSRASAKGRGRGDAVDPLVAHPPWASTRSGGTATSLRGAACRDLATPSASPPPTAPWPALTAASGGLVAVRVRKRSEPRRRTIGLGDGTAFKSAN